MRIIIPYSNLLLYFNYCIQAHDETFSIEWNQLLYTCAFDFGKYDKKIYNILIDQNESIVTFCLRIYYFSTNFLSV